MSQGASLRLDVLDGQVGQAVLAELADDVKDLNSRSQRSCQSKRRLRITSSGLMTPTRARSSSTTNR
jgi:hypothetical protein